MREQSKCAMTIAELLKLSVVLFVSSPWNVIETSKEMRKLEVERSAELHVKLKHEQRHVMLAEKIKQLCWVASLKSLNEEVEKKFDEELMAAKTEMYNLGYGRSVKALTRKLRQIEKESMMRMTPTKCSHAEHDHTTCQLAPVPVEKQELADSVSENAKELIMHLINPSQFNEKAFGCIAEKVMSQFCMIISDKEFKLNSADFMDLCQGVRALLLVKTEFVSAEKSEKRGEGLVQVMKTQCLADTLRGMLDKHGHEHCDFHKESLLGHLVLAMCGAYYQSVTAKDKHNEVAKNMDVDPHVWSVYRMFLSLVHDCGKPATQEMYYSKKHGKTVSSFNFHDLVGEAAIRCVLFSEHFDTNVPEKLRISNKPKDAIATAVGHHMMKPSVDMSALCTVSELVRSILVGLSWDDSFGRIGISEGSHENAIFAKMADAPYMTAGQFREKKLKTGHVISVIGDPGSGKTTMAKNIVGFLGRGRAVVLDRDVLTYVSALVNHSKELSELSAAFDEEFKLIDLDSEENFSKMYDVANRVLVQVENMMSALADPNDARHTEAKRLHAKISKIAHHPTTRGKIAAWTNIFFEKKMSEALAAGKVVVTATLASAESQAASTMYSPLIPSCIITHVHVLRTTEFTDAEMTRHSTDSEKKTPSKEERDFHLTAFLNRGISRLLSVGGSKPMTCTMKATGSTGLFNPDRAFVSGWNWDNESELHHWLMSIKEDVQGDKFAKATKKMKELDAAWKGDIGTLMSTLLKLYDDATIRATFKILNYSLVTDLLVPFPVVSEMGWKLWRLKYIEGQGPARMEYDWQVQARSCHVLCKHSQMEVLLTMQRGLELLFPSNIDEGTENISGLKSMMRDLWSGIINKLIAKAINPTTESAMTKEEGINVVMVPKLDGSALKDICAFEGSLLFEMFSLIREDPSMRFVNEFSKLTSGVLNGVAYVVIPGTNNCMWMLQQKMQLLKLSTLCSEFGVSREVQVANAPNVTNFDEKWVKDMCERLKFSKTTTEKIKKHYNANPVNISAAFDLIGRNGKTVGMHVREAYKKSLTALATKFPEGNPRGQVVTLCFEGLSGRDKDADGSSCPFSRKNFPEIASTVMYASHKITMAVLMGTQIPSCNIDGNLCFSKPLAHLPIPAWMVPEFTKDSAGVLTANTPEKRNALAKSFYEKFPLFEPESAMKQNADGTIEYELPHPEGHVGYAILASLQWMWVYFKAKNEAFYIFHKVEKHLAPALSIAYAWALWYPAAMKLVRLFNFDGKKWITDIEAILSEEYKKYAKNTEDIPWSRWCNTTIGMNVIENAFSTTNCPVNLRETMHQRCKSKEDIEAMVNKVHQARARRWKEERNKATKKLAERLGTLNFPKLFDFIHENMKNGEQFYKVDTAGMPKQMAQTRDDFIYLLFAICGPVSMEL